MGGRLRRSGEWLPGISLSLWAVTGIFVGRYNCGGAGRRPLVADDCQAFRLRLSATYNSVAEYR